MMTVAFLRIRLIQFSRVMAGIGIFRVIFLLLLAGLAGMLLFHMTGRQPGSYYAAGMMFLLILFIHANRRDRHFLMTNFDHPQRVMMAEYLVLSIPVSVFMVVHLQWIALTVLILAVCPVSYLDLNFRQIKTSGLLQRFIPDSWFEVKGGMRRTQFILIPLWLIGLFGSVYTGVVPVVIFLLGVVTVSFYERGEPYVMIVAFETGANRFLMRKMTMAASMLTILCLPLTIVYGVFNHELWYIPVIEYFLFITIHIFLVLNKYAFYEPGERSPAAQTFAAIGVMSGIIPLFLPVVWLLSVRFYFRSREKLNFYLDDFH